MEEDSKKVGLSVNEMIQKFRQEPVITTTTPSEDGHDFKKPEAYQTQDFRSSKK